MAKSILIVGGNGFIGSALARALSKEHTVHCTHQRSFTPIPNVTFHPLIEIANKDRCRAITNKVNPEIIIYAAGSNDPAGFENDQFKAQIVFSGGPGAMIAATEVSKAKFIFLSSDFVFAGIDGNYKENENPLSFNQFGKAMVGGENYVKSRSMNHVVIRSGPLMGRGPLDHPSWIDEWRETLFLKKPLKVPSKTFHNPAAVQSLIDAIRHIIAVDLRNKTLHIGGLSKVSMLEMANIFATKFGFDQSLIQASDAESNTTYDFSLNFTETLKLLETKPLLLEQCLDLI